MSKDIIEGNKLIAEFMKEENISAIFQTEPFVTEVRISHNMIDELEKQGAEVRLYYHDNWNKLMPIVEKIEKYAKVEIGSYQIIIWYKYEQELKSPDGFYCSIPVNTGEAKIDITWEAIIAFITWYNQQNT